MQNSHERSSYARAPKASALDFPLWPRTFGRRTQHAPARLLMLSFLRNNAVDLRHYRRIAPALLLVRLHLHGVEVPPFVAAAKPVQRTMIKLKQLEDGARWPLRMSQRSLLVERQ